MLASQERTNSTKKRSGNLLSELEGAFLKINKHEDTAKDCDDSKIDGMDVTNGLSSSSANSGLHHGLSSETNIAENGLTSGLNVSNNALTSSVKNYDSTDMISPILSPPPPPPPPLPQPKTPTQKGYKPSDTPSSSTTKPKVDNKQVHVNRGNMFDEMNSWFDKRKESGDSIDAAYVNGEPVARVKALAKMDWRNNSLTKLRQQKMANTEGYFGRTAKSKQSDNTSKSDTHLNTSNKVNTVNNQNVKTDTSKVTLNESEKTAEKSDKPLLSVNAQHTKPPVVPSTKLKGGLINSASVYENSKNKTNINTSDNKPRSLIDKSKDTQRSTPENKNNVLKSPTLNSRNSSHFHVSKAQNTSNTKNNPGISETTQANQVALAISNLKKIDKKPDECTPSDITTSVDTNGRNVPNVKKVETNVKMTNTDGKTIGATQPQTKRFLSHGNSTLPRTKSSNFYDKIRESVQAKNYVVPNKNTTYTKPTVTDSTSNKQTDLRNVLKPVNLDKTTQLTKSTVSKPMEKVRSNSASPVRKDFAQKPLSPIFNHIDSFSRTKDVTDSKRINSQTKWADVLHTTKTLDNSMSEKSRSVSDISKLFGESKSDSFNRIKNIKDNKSTSVSRVFSITAASPKNTQQNNETFNNSTEKLNRSKSNVSSSTATSKETSSVQSTNKITETSPNKPTILEKRKETTDKIDKSPTHSVERVPSTRPVQSNVKKKFDTRVDSKTGRSNLTPLNVTKLQDKVGKSEHSVSKSPTRKSTSPIQTRINKKLESISENNKQGINKKDTSENTKPKTTSVIVKSNAKIMDDIPREKSIVKRLSEQFNRNSNNSVISASCENLNTSSTKIDNRKFILNNMPKSASSDQLNETKAEPVNPELSESKSSIHEVSMVLDNSFAITPEVRFDTQAIDGDDESSLSEVSDLDEAETSKLMRFQRVSNLSSMHDEIRYGKTSDANMVSRNNDILPTDVMQKNLINERLSQLSRTEAMLKNMSAYDFDISDVTITSSDSEMGDLNKKQDIKQNDDIDVKIKKEESKLIDVKIKKEELNLKNEINMNKVYQEESLDNRISQTITNGTHAQPTVSNSNIGSNKVIAVVDIHTQPTSTNIQNNKNSNHIDINHNDIPTTSNKISLETGVDNKKNILHIPPPNSLTNISPMSTDESFHSSTTSLSSAHITVSKVPSSATLPGFSEILNTKDNKDRADMLKIDIERTKNQRRRIESMKKFSRSEPSLKKSHSASNLGSYFASTSKLNTEKQKKSKTKHKKTEKDTKQDNVRHHINLTRSFPVSKNRNTGLQLTQSGSVGHSQQVLQKNKIEHKNSGTSASLYSVHFDENPISRMRQNNTSQNPTPILKHNSFGSGKNQIYGVERNIHTKEVYRHNSMNLPRQQKYLTVHVDGVDARYPLLSHKPEIFTKFNVGKRRSYSKDQIVINSEQRIVKICYDAEAKMSSSFNGVKDCPIIIDVEDGGMPTTYGDGLVKGEEDKLATFFVDAHNLHGELAVQVDGPNSIAKCTIEEKSKGLFAVSYIPVEVGRYNVVVKWNGKEITGSPFHPSVVDARKVRVIGGWQHYMDNNDKIHLVANEEKRIGFDVTDAGSGQLTAKVIGPNSNLIPVHVDHSADRKATIIFTPREEGTHHIHAYWCEHPLVNSPFVGHARISSKLSPDHTKVILSGRGLKEAVTHEKAEFIIDGSEAGPGRPDVRLEGLKRSLDAHLIMVGPGKYKCEYMADIAGAYLLHISWNGRTLKGSPFKVNVMHTHQQQRIQVTGEGLRGGMIGKDISVTIDTRHAEPGELSAHCMGPQQVAHCNLTDLRNGTYRLSIHPTESGRHTLHIKYSGEHVFGSPYILMVYAQPDASKVRVSGAGVEHGILARFASHFLVETKGAGAGELTVRIKGPKGAFQVEMIRNHQKDRTIMCQYDPRETGLYIIHVRWSGVDVPGSPFYVQIVDSQNELERVLTEEKYNGQVHSMNHSGYNGWRDEY